VVTGTGFTSTSTVSFNGTPAAITARTLPSRLVVTVPAAAAGGPILVTNTAAPVGTVESAARFNPEICGTTGSAPPYAHVVVIPEENHSFTSIVGSSDAPYINTVAKQCGLAERYHSITHPSLPEYIAATSGLPFDQLTPFVSDCSPKPGCTSAADNIFHQAASWKSYVESMPSNCDITGAGTYAPRHNPAVYYTDLSNCAANDVPLGTTSSSPLLSDFHSDATAPSVSWVVPDLCDDMHGVTNTCPGGPARIQAGDSWLKQWLPLITSTPTYQAGDTAIFIVWDEGGGPDSVKGERCASSADPSCRVPAIVIAPSVPAGTRSITPFTHYSLLKTTENLLRLPELASAATATSMAAAFGL
jgi:phospholipase C